MTKQEMIDFLRGNAVFVGDVIGEIVDYIEHSERTVYCKECKESKPYSKPAENSDGRCGYDLLPFD